MYRKSLVFLALALLLFLPLSLMSRLSASFSMPNAQAGEFATYYVRSDGGSTEQCSGLVDAPYQGSGVGQACAWDHPFRALPPGGSPRIAGGDTLMIAAGSYMMGYGAPGSDGLCASEYPWDCHMPALPSGPDAANPTRILGAGWQDGCSIPPQLWGTERARMILNLTDASHVQVACLEITDHSGCVEFHSGTLTCERNSFPYGQWASMGLYAEDSTDVQLQDLNIHGLASTGVLAGRLSDWTVENVQLIGNGWVGWNGDLGTDSSNAGTLRFRHWTVAWNGCGESWPPLPVSFPNLGEGMTGCWGQTAGGYGDGVGTANTEGHWIIEDSAFLYNTSDGLDLLYMQPGASVEIRRTIAQGNAGNQIKTNGPTTIENSIIVGNCGYFDGQSFTYNVDHCRALGNALSLGLRAGEQTTVTNSTFASEGDCLVTASCDGQCNGSESIVLRNTIFQGHTDFLQPFEQTCLIYQETFPSNPFEMDHSLITDVKNDLCPGPNDICGGSLGLTNPSIDAFDARLLGDSPAINEGTTNGAPTDDFAGQLRDNIPDIGAYEYSASTPTATPTPTTSPSPTVTITPTKAASATVTMTPTKGPSPTVTSTVSGTLPFALYLPLIIRNPPQLTPTPTATPSATSTVTATLIIEPPTATPTSTVLTVTPTTILTSTITPTSTVETVTPTTTLTSTITPTSTVFANRPTK